MCKHSDFPKADRKGGGDESKIWPHQRTWWIPMTTSKDNRLGRVAQLSPLGETLHKHKAYLQEANGLGTRLVGLLWHYTFRELFKLYTNVGLTQESMANLMHSTSFWTWSSGRSQYQSPSDWLSCNCGGDWEEEEENEMVSKYTLSSLMRPNSTVQSWSHRSANAWPIHDSPSPPSSPCQVHTNTTITARRYGLWKVFHKASSCCVNKFHNRPTTCMRAQTLATSWLAMEALLGKRTVFLSK